jgi:hypothetical protein
MATIVINKETTLGSGIPNRTTRLRDFELVASITVSRRQLYTVVREIRERINNSANL